MSNNSIRKLGSPKPTVDRRRFLSSAIVGGAAISIGRQVANGREPLYLTESASECAETDLKAIDSLSLSPKLLSDVYSIALCPFQQTVVDKTGEVTDQYQKLLRLADELEQEAPELKDNAAIQKIREGGKAGIESVARINNLANTSAALAPGFVQAAMSSLDADDLLTVESRLSGQQNSVTLSPAAVKILRMLLRELRNVHEYVVEADAAAKKLRQASIDIQEAIQKVRGLIFEAMSELAKQDKSNTSLKIVDAKSALEGIDLSYQTALHALSSTSRKQCEKDNGNRLPCEFLRQYLDGTEALIAEEIAQLKHYRGDNPEYGVRFVRASFPAGPGVSDLVPLVGTALGEKLVEDTKLRRDSGACAVRPYLRYNGDVRIRKFAKALELITPGGRDDGDAGKRMEAAKRLHELLVARGW